MDKYFDGDYSKFHVKNEDGTLDETINLNESLVEDVKDFVAFLKNSMSSGMLKSSLLSRPIPHSLSAHAIIIMIF